MRARAAKTSRLVSGAAVIGLIAISTILAVLLNSVALFSNYPSTSGKPGSVDNQDNGQVGQLEVQLQVQTTENQSDPFAPPVAVPQYLADQSVIVVQVTNSTNPFTAGLPPTTELGTTSTTLDPGRYLVKYDYQTLDVSIPVNVTASITTFLTVNFYENAYPLVYNEQFGLTLAVAGVEAGMYVQVETSQPVEAVNAPVILYVENNGSAGSPVDANVILSNPPLGGTQWLEIASGTGWPNTIQATSLLITTWSYKSSVTTNSY